MSVDELVVINEHAIEMLRTSHSPEFIFINNLKLDELLTIAAYYSQKVEGGIKFNSAELAQALKIPDPQMVDWALSSAVGNKYIAREESTANATPTYFMPEQSVSFLARKPLERFTPQTIRYLKESAPLVYEKLTGQVICQAAKDFVGTFLETYKGQTITANVHSNGTSVTIALTTLRLGPKPQFGPAAFIPSESDTRKYRLADYDFPTVTSMASYFRDVLRERKIIS